MEFTVEENIPGLLIFIDFQKAFDSLELNFMLRCLESFNFGSSLIRWVFTFYKKIYKAVYLTRVLSLNFLLSSEELDKEILFLHTSLL